MSLRVQTDITLEHKCHWEPVHSCPSSKVLACTLPSILSRKLPFRHYSAVKPPPGGGSEYPPLHAFQWPAPQFPKISQAGQEDPDWLNTKEEEEAINCLQLPFSSSLSH